LAVKSVVTDDNTDSRRLCCSSGARSATWVDGGVGDAADPDQCLGGIASVWFAVFTLLFIALVFTPELRWIAHRP
jgi:hypothetical protein